MEGSVCILESAVGVKNGMGIRISLHSLVKGLEYKRIIVSVSNHKGDYAPVIEIQNGAEVNFVDFNTLIPLKLSYICEPLFVRGFGTKISVQYILCNVLRILRPPCAAVVVIFNGGLDIFLSADPQDSFVVDMNIVVVAKVVIDATIALVRTIRMDLLDLFCDCFVLNGSGTFTARNPPVIRRPGYLQQLAGFLNAVSAFRAIFLNRPIKMALPYLR